MSMVNKEPYITPEMISAWNSGGGRIYSVDVEFTPSEFVAWGSDYYVYKTLNLAESIRNKKILVTFKAVSPAGAWISLNQEPSPVLADSQLQIFFTRPNVPSANLKGTVYIYVID